MSTQVHKFVSADGKLYSGMTQDDVKNKKYKNNKTMNDAIIVFQKADEDNDGVLSISEISEYNQDCKKFFWKKFLVGTGVALGIGAVGFAAFRGIKLSNALKETTAQLAQTTAELNKTKASLTEAKNVIAEIQQIVTESNQKTNIQKSLSQIPFSKIFDFIKPKQFSYNGLSISW